MLDVSVTGISLNQVYANHRSACAWFLLSRKSVCIQVFVHPKTGNTWNGPGITGYKFSVSLYVALDINIIDRW